MALPRCSTRRFGLSTTWLVVVVVSPLWCSRRRRHVGSPSWCWPCTSSSSWRVRHRSFLLIDPPWPLRDRSSLPATVGFDLLSLVSICCRWFRFAVVVFDSPWLALIRPHWFRVAVVGFLVISPLRLLDALPLCLVVSPICLLTLPSLPLLVSSLLLVVSTLLHFAPAPYSLAFSSLSFALYSGLSPFLLVVVSSPLRRCVTPLRR